MEHEKIIYSYSFILVGCSADITENPTSPQDNTSVKSQTLPKQISAGKITHEKVFPEVLKFMETKRKEYGITYSPNLKPQKSQRVDITKIPGIVIPALSEIEKLYQGNGKYFSGHNYKQIEDASPMTGKSSPGPSIVQNDFITFDYYSWCIPYPSPQKPWFEYMGSGQELKYNGSPFPMDDMYVRSYHFFNSSLQDYVEAEDYDVSSIEASDWHEQAQWPYFWEVGGYHYGWNYSPWIQIETVSYAYDGDI